MSDNAPKISRELMGKIVDEVFDGAIEDCSVIEEIYAAIKRHEADEHPTTTVKVAGYSAEPDFAVSIKRTCSEEASNGAACGWTPCTGCYDTEDGHPTAHYPHSRIFGCDVGSGCSECGGLGVVFQYWSPEDLEDMQRDCVSETPTTPPAPHMEPVQDTYFVDSSLPVMAISGDVESDRVLKLHFRRPVSDEDRKALTDALNLHQRSLASTSAPQMAGDQHPDSLAVDRFSAAMKAKLAKKREEGRGGWEDKDRCTNAFLSQLLLEHVAKGDPVDVGNLAMMLHQRGESICALTEHVAAVSQLHAIVDAWEVLPGGRQARNCDVERWLSDDMSPAINAIRGFLRRPRPDGILPPPPAPQVTPPIEATSSVIDRARASKAAVKANNAYGQWMPERWLHIFLDAYEGKSR